jgi:hypothetical protein
MGESSDNSVDVAPLSVTAAEPVNAVEIAMNQVNPAQFAADATNIYFTTIEEGGTGACKIMKLAK